MDKKVSVKTMIISIAAVVIIMCAIFATVLLVQNKNSNQQIEAKNVDIRAGDKINMVEIYNEASEKLEKLFDNRHYTVLFYTSAGCTGCKQVLDNYDKLNSIFGKKLNFAVLWVDSIPENAAENYKINNNLTLQGAYRLASSTPTMLVLDGDDNVVFTTTDLASLTEKLLDISDKDEIRVNAQKYIISRYSQNLNNNRQIIYFSMQGCPDCAAADEIIENSSGLANYEITRIYSKSATDENLLIDSFGIFAQIFDIEWYPSFFVTYDNQAVFVGECPTEQIEEKLLSLERS